MKVVYKPYLQSQISLAFDVFYWILSHVDKLSKQAMNQADPDYHLKNSCPTCHYKVSNHIQDQTKQCPSWIIMFRSEMSLGAPSSLLSQLMGIPHSQGYAIILLLMLNSFIVIISFPENKLITLQTLGNICNMAFRYEH